MELLSQVKNKLSGLTSMASQYLSSTAAAAVSLNEHEPGKDPDEDIDIQPTPIFRMRGEVVKGFQRGSKLLGWPTANLDPKAFKDVLVDVPRGVYCGFASINGGKVHRTVLSLGYNPQFNNDEETVEAYIVHEFENDFYGEEMELLICGFLRPQWSYTDMDSLKRAIGRDVRVGCSELDSTMKQYASDPFFKRNQPSPSPSSSSTSPPPLTSKL